jgi:UDP-2-acetamido-2,6-beta-L-arabino-hexul-4-ose reductase|tara:strand:- start:453 stop:1499 length:1047 start_codon:yes stop_codon:yes gene_type:complete
MKVAITGEQGFLGYHLTQYYKWVKEYEVIELGRNYLDNIALLKNCDLLIHCAGINRGDNVYEGNISLAQNLVDTLNKNNISIDIKFTSSTQEDANNEYGNSKMKSKEILADYCNKNNTRFEPYKMPNIFGPFGKPNYNSFINTFCYNLVNNINVTHNNNAVALCYVYDAIKAIDNNTKFNTVTISTCDVYYKLKSFHNDYSQGIIPNLIDNFDKNLFNTYRSFAAPIFKFKKHSDDRGHLVELVKGRGSETQVFFSTTKPNITRGDHFHFNKVERFCVLSGKAKISLRKVGNSKVNTYIVEGENNKVVDMPILHTHNITNIGSEDLVCVFWVNEIFDPKNPDTYFSKV